MKEIFKKVALTPKERGEFIKKKYKEKGLDQKILACKLGIDAKKLNQYITGSIKTIPEDIINSICKELDINKETEFFKWQLPAWDSTQHSSVFLQHFACLLEFAKEHDEKLTVNNDVEYYNEILQSKMSGVMLKYIDKLEKEKKLN